MNPGRIQSVQVLIIKLIIGFILLGEHYDVHRWHPPLVYVMIHLYKFKFREEEVTPIKAKGFR